MAALAACGVAVQSSSRWVISAAGKSCTDACAALPDSPPCHLESMQQVSSLLHFRRVKEALMSFSSPTCVQEYGEAQVHGPSVDVSTAVYSLEYLPQCFVGGNISTCDAFAQDIARFCCCGNTACSHDYSPRWQLEGVDVVAPALHHTFDRCAIRLYAAV
jgi:hypothetical protein